MKKKILITLSVLMLYTLTVFGQTKYEYCNITYSPSETKIFVTIDKTEYSSEKVDVPRNEQTYMNCKPLFEKVEEYQERGWELINYSDIAFINGFYKMAYLRRNKE